MYPILSGRPDLYRAFMAQVWTHASHTGISGLIHLETHFTDDKATSIRAAAYRHLRRHWQFINELVLFDIQHQKRYGVNVYGAQKDPQFLHAASLYHPHTVIRSLVHDGTGPEPGIKNDEGQWDQRPHVGRIQRIDTGVLRAWQDALGADHWSTTPMLYTVNAAATRTLQTLASAPRMRDLWLQYSAGWNETTDKQRGRFRQHWGSSSWSDAILQGSHLYVSRPLYKWPNSTMKHHLDWTDVDLESLNPDALPVTSFEPSGDPATYDASYTHWGEARTPARDHYRVAWRRMAANTGERTLIPALIPPGAAHIDGVFSAASRDDRVTVAVAGVLSSLLSDFAVRSAPKGDIRAATINRLAMVPLDHALLPKLILRTLRLNCLTEAYAGLWAACWDESFLDDAPILPRYDELPIGPTWTPSTPLRRAADRRNAQVEIDALVALMLDVPVEDLCTIYRTQFAVLHGYDQRDYTYDTTGRLVPNSILSRWRKQGEPKDTSQLSEIDCAAIHPDSGIVFTYVPPFAPPR